jgi:hypothetical protein
MLPSIAIFMVASFPLPHHPRVEGAAAGNVMGENIETNDKLNE